MRLCLSISLKNKKFLHLLFQAKSPQSGCALLIPLLNRRGQTFSHKNQSTSPLFTFVMSKRARPTSLVSTRSSKRKKIVRTPTVELEEEEVQENLLDRKTTSFLEQIEDENVSVLSSKSRSKLLSRLSSIFNPESIGKRFSFYFSFLTCHRARTNRSL